MRLLLVSGAARNFAGATRLRHARRNHYAILPEITDSPENIANVVRAAREAGAQGVWHDTLHLHEVTREAFIGYLRAKRPELIASYACAYREKYAAREVHDRIEARVDDAMDASPSLGLPFIEPDAPRQLSLI